MRKWFKKTIFLVCSWLWHDPSPKVVFYHDIGKTYTPMGTPSELFQAHLACLREGDVVCFDDGFRGIWDNRELLREGRGDTRGSADVERIRINIFLAVGLVGRAGYLSWDEIRILQNEYGIEFQCHTWSHQTLVGPWNEEEPIPPGRTDEWYQHELAESKAEIERRLGKEVTALCFPVGYFSDDVIRRCKAFGYEKVYASYPGNKTEEYVQPRCLVQNMGVEELKAVLNGGMNVLCGRYLLRHKCGGK